MKRLAILIAFAVSLFASCRKEQTFKVTYVVKEYSAEQPMYTITYTAEKSGGSNIASSTNERWSSDGIELERGQYVSMKLRSDAPVYELTMFVYVNGYLWRTETFSNPVREKEVNGTL
jgi:hypothetical protein